MLYNTINVTNQGLFMELRVTRNKALIEAPNHKRNEKDFIKQSNDIETTTGEKQESKETKKVLSQTKPEPKKKNVHKDHRSRLKNQFLENGVDGLTDIQKLELLLFYAIPQKDTNPIAHNLLAEFGSLSGVLHASFNELKKVSGIKENSATLLKFFSSMLNFCSRPTEDDTIPSSGKAKTYAAKYFNHITVEQFYVFCLTKTNKVKKAFLINSGTDSEVSVEIRNITEKSLETNCTRMIIAHNHPNGRAVMSPQDCKFTYSLLCSCILNNIELLDHIIVGTDKPISLYEQGIMAKLKQRATETIQISTSNRLFVSENPEGYEKSIEETPAFVEF